MIQIFRTDKSGQTVQSADLDQTAPEEGVWSGTTLFAILSDLLDAVSKW